MAVPKPQSRGKRSDAASAPGGDEVWGRRGGTQSESSYEANNLASYNVLSTPVNGKALHLACEATAAASEPSLLGQQLA